MITNIEIKNFKCFEHEKLELKPLTLITGTNSSGKSSLLQAILMLVEHRDIELETYIHSLGGFDDLKNKYTNPAQFDISTVLRKQQFANLKASKERKVREQSPKYLMKYPGNVTYLNANRKVFNDLQTTNRADKEERNFGITGEFIAGYYDEFKDEPINEALKVGEADSYTLEGQVNYWLKRISNFDYQLETEKINSTNVKVSYKNSDGLTFKPGNIGTGISFLATIIIACLTATEDSLLIIENPEIHLHPLAQSKLAGFFAFVASKGVQLIIETHNDHLLNRIRFEIFADKLNSSDVVIYYKEAKIPFKRINITSAGIFENEQGENVFPAGFYDATLQQIFAINQGKQ